MAVELHVSGLGGPLCSVSANRCWTIFDLKAAIHFETDIPEDEQSLFVGTAVFRDTETLDKLPASDSVDVTLVRMLRSPEEEEWLEKVERNGLNLGHAPSAIAADFKIVLAAVKQNGKALQFAADHLRAHRDIVWAAVRSDGLALEFAAGDLQADEELCQAARSKAQEWIGKLEEDGLLLAQAPMSIRSNREVVLAAVHQNGRALRYADEVFSDDREVAQAAVRSAGRALRYASERLRDDCTIVFDAVTQNGFALEFAMEKPRHDRACVRAAVQQVGALAILEAAEELKADRELILMALRHPDTAPVHAPRAFAFASPRLLEDREVMLAAVTKNGRMLSYASDRLRADREVVLAAVRDSGFAAIFAAPELLADPEVEAARRGSCINDMMIANGKAGTRSFEASPCSDVGDLVSTDSNIGSFRAQFYLAGASFS